MDIDEFAVLMDQVKGQQDTSDHPEDFHLFDQWRAEETDLASVEQALSVRFPMEYRQFMMRFGGGMFLFMDVLPVLSPDGREPDVLRVNQEQLKRPDFVAVAPVGSGDWWGFRASDGECEVPVSFWDHEDGSVSEVAESWLIFVARQGLQVGP